MRYYKISEDWISNLEGDFRCELLACLRRLELQTIQKYPPPKLSGLPFGNEPRIVSQFLKGRSLQLEPSALARFYRSRTSSRESLLYDAFRMNKALSGKAWAEIVGPQNVQKWVENKGLWQDGADSFYCAFSVVALDDLVFCVDPLNDHGNSREPQFVSAENIDDSPAVQPFFHTYIGSDSLRMIEWMEREDFSKGGRYLDCGTGSGCLLLFFGRRFNEAVGVDINPRAAKLAEFNAELNGRTNCTAVCDDAINRKKDVGKFDLVSWNLPFIFMPEKYSDEFIDGFGGEMGIGLCLQFIETLKPLLNDNGRACVAALAPILDSGDNVLESRLKPLLPTAGLDCTVMVAQMSVAPTKELWDFHRSNGIRKFEAVYLILKPGNGAFLRVEAPPLRKAIDIVRETLYTRKYAGK